MQVVLKKTKKKAKGDITTKEVTNQTDCRRRLLLRFHGLRGWRCSSTHCAAVRYQSECVALYTEHYIAKPEQERADVDGPDGGSAVEAGGGEGVAIGVPAYTTGRAGVNAIEHVGELE